MRNSKIQVLVECALAVALSVVLNLIAVRLPINVAGGSISFTMLPVAIVALRRGAVTGATAGALFGLFDLLMEPYIVHWAQVIFDYPLPYLLFGLGVGCFARAYTQVSGDTGDSPSQQMVTRGSLFIVLAFLIGGLLRIVSHVLSGVIFFAEYAGDQNVWIYSLVYNLSYLAPSLVASFILALIITPILARAVPVARAKRP